MLRTKKIEHWRIEDAIAFPKYPDMRNFRIGPSKKIGTTSKEHYIPHMLVKVNKSVKRRMKDANYLKGKVDNVHDILAPFYHRDYC